MSLRDRIEQRSHAVLFYAVLALMLVPSFLEDDTPLEGIVHGALLTIVFVTAIVGVLRLDQRATPILAVLALLGLVASWAIVGTDRLAPAASGLRAAFELLLVAVILKSILFEEKSITSERLYGAAVIYFFFAAGCADLYLLIEHIEPNSFNLPGGVERLSRDQAGYFSFVTQTTLGYGDISPRAPAARGLAVVQSALGVLYMAILVARLATATDAPKDDED